MFNQVFCPFCNFTMTDDGSLSGQGVACPNCAGQFIMPVRQIAVAQPVTYSPYSAPQSDYHSVSHYRGETKSTGAAAVLSFLWPGAGQIYNGQIFKGLFFVFLWVALAIISLMLYGIGIPFMIILWIYAIYNGHSTADRINRRNYRR